MKKVITRIVIFVCIVLVAGTIFFIRYSNRTRFNDGYPNGNTAGNLYNSGNYCERNGIVYFANPSDNSRLYSMNPDGTDLKKLSEDSVAYINADDFYIYYVRTSSGVKSQFSFLHINTNSLCRIRQDGKGDVKVLDDDPCIYGSLVGNNLYYLHYDTETATNLYQIRIDGTEKRRVNANSYFTCSTNGQYIYYNGLESDHNIYQFDTTTNSQSLIYAGNCWMPTVVDGTTAYFMDCDHNYCLAKVDLNTGEKTILTRDRIDCYNLYGNYIYFQRNDSENPALCRINVDGSGYEEIRSGNYTEINATSTYIYFKNFTTQVTYRMPVSGGAVEIFQP